jgi:hypothetical protein
MMLEPPLTPPAPPLERERGAFVFFSYAHRDKGFRDRLEEHLSNLKYRGLITTWYDREISAGEEWAQQIDIYLNKAHIILLLISASFMASEYCYSIEMRRALERHERHEADVVPILLRPVLYTDAPFAKLQMLPTNGKPIVRWRDRDSAFVDIAYAIERVAQKYLPPSLATPPRASEPPDEETQMQPSAPLSVPKRGHHIFSPAVLIAVATVVVSSILASSLASHYSGCPSPGCPPSGSSSLLPVILLGLLLLAGIAAVLWGVLKAIGAIRARIGERQAQKVREAAAKRSYYEETIDAYRRALLLNPSDGNAYRGMGNALFALERYNEALDAFTRAIDCDSTPAAYAGLGDVFARLKRYSEAVVAYEKAIELDPTVTLNHGDLMQALRALGRKEEAERVHARAKQLGYEDQE